MSNKYKRRSSKCFCNRLDELAYLRHRQRWRHFGALPPFHMRNARDSNRALAFGRIRQRKALNAGYEGGPSGATGRSIGMPRVTPTPKGVPWKLDLNYIRFRWSPIRV